MENKNEEPLLSISKNTQNEEISKENIYPHNINTFFIYLKDKDISQQSKSLILEELINKIKINRYICEFFSSYEEESIYLFLFKLYLDDSTNNDLKQSILNLIKELRINIEANKIIFDFLFQKMARLYRIEDEPTSEKLYSYLVLLNAILGETENMIKPRNYFSCSGDCKFELNIDRRAKLDLGQSITFIINFRIGTLNEQLNNEITSNLMKIEFSNGYKINFDLKYPVFLIVTKIRDSFIRTLPNDEWINLVINIIMVDNNPTIYFLVNGENHLIPFKLPQNSFSKTEHIKSITFFNNFYGEVGSIIMLSQKQNSSCVNSSEFLLFFKQYKEGFWKKKKLDELIHKLKSIEPSSKEAQKSLTFQTKSFGFPLTLLENKLETANYLSDSLIFIFTPFSTSYTQKGLIENCLSNPNYKLMYNGNAKLHNYICYQKKLSLIQIITNIIPIAEIFLIHPETFNENNFEIFLKILENILKYRKNNIDSFKECKVFPILSLFFEKYPKKYFTEKILTNFINIGIAIFSTESLCSTYFKYIILNEKILSKYSEELQIKFWEHIMLFCKADNTLIEKFINMNRLCLILRFYDRNKYKEMCCKEHLESIKEEFNNNFNVMNPPMHHILKGIKGILDVIISGTEPKNAIILFKLLILDLSPCLIKFIINIFLNALRKEDIDNKWKDEFVIELIDSKFEVIMMNTFIHSLLEIRIEILYLMNEIHKRLNSMQRGNSKILEKMLKTCLIPQNMFYFPKKDIQNNNNEEKENEILIFKDNLYEEYKYQLLNIFFSWSLGRNIDEDLDTYDIKQSVIKNINILEVLFSVSGQLKDPNFSLKFIHYLDLLVEKEQNAYKILLNKKIISSILDISFKISKIEDQIISNIYNKTKNLISNLFNNTISYLVNSKIIYPFDEIDTSLFLWGDRIIIDNEDSKIAKDDVFDFLNDLLLVILTSFKVKFEGKMNFNLANPDFNPNNNFFLKNYYILLTQLFRFCFQFKYDTIILSNEISLLPPSQNINNTLDLYISSMRIKISKGKTINGQWAEYPFFDDLYKRLRFIWSKNNTFKNKINDKKKKNKLEKYKEILETIILDKDKKNIFMKELSILTYEEFVYNKEYIVSLLKIISISLMCILSVSINNTDFMHWLKEFKYFIRFLIIASSNLTRKDQLEYYISIQEKCINVLISCFAFWKNLILTNSEYKTKIEKSFESILLFCFLIIKYQYQYNGKHKIKLFKSLRKNDLVSCSVYVLFTEKIKDKNGNPLITLEKVDKNSLNEYNALFIEMKNKVWDELLYDNNGIKEQLDNNYFCLKGYKYYVDKRYKLLQSIRDVQDDNYKKAILVLLPLYEKELTKYSNNSLETKKKIKNYYKKYKKQSFSWRGYWSDRILFFEMYDKLKLKIINHYSKHFMKPVLAPILDMSYYLPEFSGFNPDSLFNIDEKNKEKIFELTMDMDKILNIEEQKNEQLKNDNLQNDNFLRNVYLKSNPELANNYKKISNNLDFGKKEEFAILEKDPKNESETKNKYFLACLVKPSHHIKGVFFIGKNELDFKVFLNQKTGNEMSEVEVAFTTSDDDYDLERQTCFGSYFICHPKDKDLYRISINYNDIKYIFRRRYYYKNSSIEIYTSANKTFYFNFKYEKDREIVLNEIVNRLKEYARILDDLKEPKDNFENVVGYQNTLVLKARKKNGKKKFKIKLSKKILAWKEWKMSTFELLMWMNIYANRSYNDISQYPVFPWILSSYEDPLKNDSNEYNYRDLSLPMGMMTINDEGERRKELFMETFDVLKNESDGSIKPYIYGSNYSNPMYVCNFMMRLFPFTHISIELQGNKFDDANRLFLSVQNSFYNSITQKTDVRELIPEFFYLPEIFLNINNLNMGVEENGKKVNDVLTPCQNNPYQFILTMRSELEEEKVSNNIQKWIDLIFGYKSKGKEAESAYNLFTEASYQEDININSIEDKESFLRRVEFGLIPNQIITKDCSKRDKKEDFIKDKQIIDNSAKIVSSSTKKDAEKNENYNEEFLIQAKYNTFDKLTLIFNNNLLIEKKIAYNIFEKNYKEEIINKIDLGKEMNQMSEFYSNNSDNNKVIEICNQGKIIIMGGFYDGKIKIKFLSFESSLTDKNSLELIPFNDDSVVLSIAVDSDEEYLFLGNSKGNVALYKMDIEKKSFNKLLILSDQMSPICHIHCSSVLNLWISTSIDGYINLYTLPLCKLVRSIKLQEKKCSYSFLISSPIPCIIVICDEGGNSEIFVYSINGKIISKKQEYFQINKPIIIKDAYFNEYMAYLGKNSVYIIKLPNLELMLNVDGIKNSHILCCNENMTTLYLLNKNGSEINLIRDEEKKNIRPSSFVMKNLGHI